MGTAVPTFLHPGRLVWAYLVIGAAVSTIVMLAIASVFNTWDVPVLTFPFVLTTWFLTLGAYAFANVKITALSAPAFPVATSAGAAHVSMSASVVLGTIFRNISQVFLVENAVTGIIFVLALLVSSRWSGLFALIGSSVALGSTLVLGASAASVTAGLSGSAPS